MNERIRELAKEAGMYIVDDEYSTYGKFAEKFAELLIQECLLALEPDSMASAIDYDVEEKFYKRSADKIKKHFELT